MENVGEGKRPIFGNRFLTDEKDVFKHNAWDDVSWDDEQEALAKASVEKNSQVRLSVEEILGLEKEAGNNWDKFYGIHENNFFKDRNWLFTEFEELFGSQLKILETGCGVGNSVFPILERNTSEDVEVFSCDFSNTAIHLLRENEKYKRDPRAKAFVCDLTDPTSWEVNAPFPEESLDIILAVFVLSALDPITMTKVVQNFKKYLKPGGLVLFRDYGLYDLAQLRFKDGKCINKNFYVRGDGTRCYFFTLDFLRNLFKVDEFEEIQSRYDRRLQVNRGKQLKMYRVWVQAKFRKK